MRHKVKGFYGQNPPDGFNLGRNCVSAGLDVLAQAWAGSNGAKIQPC